VKLSTNKKDDENLLQNKSGVKTAKRGKGR